MQGVQRVGQHRYQVGEEVVVRLAGVTVLDVESASYVDRLPRWTIAEITERLLSEGRAAYALRFRLAETACICVAPEAQIDGTA